MLRSTRRRRALQARLKPLVGGSSNKLRTGRSSPAGGRPEPGAHTQSRPRIIPIRVELFHNLRHLCMWSDAYCTLCGRHRRAHGAGGAGWRPWDRRARPQTSGGAISTTHTSVLCSLTLGGGDETVKPPDASIFVGLMRFFTKADPSYVRSRARVARARTHENRQS